MTNLHLANLTMSNGISLASVKSGTAEVKPRPVVAAWSFTDTEIAEAVAGKRMLNPSLDLSNACNLDCAYCYIEERGTVGKRRRANELTIEETLRIVDVFAAMGARTVNLVGSGEPTLDPAFRQVVESISGNGMQTMLFTNGALLSRDESAAEWLFEHDVSVALKFNSRTPQLQDLLVRREGYSTMRDIALARLLSAGFTTRGAATRLAVDTLVMRAVMDELPQIYRWCRRVGIHPIFAEYIPAGRTSSGHAPDHGAHEMRPLTYEEKGALQAELRRIDREEGVAAADEGCAYVNGDRCTQLLGVYVDVQGQVWPCVARTTLGVGGASHAPIGNMRAPEFSLSQLWERNAYLKAIRDGYTGECPYRSRRTPDARMLPVLHAQERA